MGRMGAEGRVKVRPGIGIRVVSRPGAGVPFMDVEAENIKAAGIRVYGKAINLRIDKDPGANHSHFGFLYKNFSCKSPELLFYYNMTVERKWETGNILDKYPLCDKILEAFVF